MEEKKVSIELLRIESKRRELELNTLLESVEPFLEELEEIGIRGEDRHDTEMIKRRFEDERSRKKAIELQNTKKRIIHESRALKKYIKNQLQFIYEQRGEIPESLYNELKSIGSQFSESKKVLFDLLKKGESELDELLNKSEKVHLPEKINQSEKGNIRFNELQKMYQKYSNLWDDAKTQEERDKIKETMLSILEQIEKYETSESELRIKHFRERAKNYRFVLSVVFSGVILTTGVWLVLTGQSEFWDVGGVFIGYGLVGLGIDLNQIKKTFSKNQTNEK